MEINEKQQLELITEMINTARRDFSDNSFIYLLWGWTVCIASLGQYVLLQMNKEYNAIGWAVLIPLAIIAQFVFMVRQEKSKKVKSHMDRIIGYVWTAVGVSLGAVLFAMNIMQVSCFPVLILLYGIGTFISGGIMKLTPMKMGGICCWVIGFTAFFVKFEYQLLLLSLSLILSYIIPGHILQNRFKANV